MTCPITSDPAVAAVMIRCGGLVALPTETVYGLGANAWDGEAVARIFAAKERPAFDPLIVHLPSVAALNQVAASISPRAQKLADAFWPGPLTLVLPKQPKISDLVTSGLSTVGVRVPAHPLMQRVLELAGVPIAAPSANRFGRLSPTTAEHVHDQLGDRIDLILDGGPCVLGVESTIVHVVADDITTVLRPGGLPTEAIAEIVGPVDIATGSSDRPAAPGMLASHYAPRTPIQIITTHPLQSGAKNWGLLQFMPDEAEAKGFTVVETLSVNGRLEEAAANFFAALHRLDRAGLDRIVATPFPEQGLGRALNDRLRRASINS